MDDQAIIGLYFDRSESAIAETAQKYGSYCFSIAFHILSDREDSEESVNDTYMAAWNNIPPRVPVALSTFLGRLTRNISLNRWRTRQTHKRGGGEMPLALEELEGCLTGGTSPEEQLEKKELLRSVNRFLAGLPETERKIFVCRYWYLDPVADTAARLGWTESRVKSQLHRTRSKLRKHLEKEGF